MNVILPCAGEGKRLGLPYPKEMHQIAYGVSLLDLSFRLLYPHQALVSRVSVVINPEKTSLVKYVSKWKQAFPIAFCFFNDENFEWAGSILSAEHLFLEKNMVLLPDSVITEAEASPVAPTMARLLDGYPLAFGYVRERSDRLHALGALHVSEDGTEVSGFCDKPAGALDDYNAFWGTFGFRATHARPILEMMTMSIQRQPVRLRNAGVEIAGAFPLAAYADLGTWNGLSGASARVLGEEPTPTGDDWSERRAGPKSGMA